MLCGQVIPHTGGLDVCFSYQSTQEATMRRLRRNLWMLGLTTADGTQVGAYCTAGYLNRCMHAALLSAWLLLMGAIDGCY